MHDRRFIPGLEKQNIQKPCFDPAWRGRERFRTKVCNFASHQIYVNYFMRNSQVIRQKPLLWTDWCNWCLAYQCTERRWTQPGSSEILSNSWAVWVIYT